MPETATTPATGTRPRTGSDLSGNPTGPRKFLNGWTKQQENLMAEWSDKAACYRWLHDRCEKKYSGYNMRMTIPVIILSTLTGTANFAIGSFIPPDDASMKNYVQAGIGAISIFAGILTTLASFLRYAQGSEAHRVSGISWGKFQRQIAVELAIHPNDRIDCMDFLKICRAELDRLIEQSPPIPDDVIEEFEREFKDTPSIKKPDICHGLEHTTVFEDKTSRLKMISSDAAMLLLQKKKMLREEVIPDLDRLVGKSVERKLFDLSGTALPIPKVDTVTPGYLSRSIGRKSSTHFDSRKKTVTIFDSVVPDLSGNSDSEDTSSDIHIDIVGSSTINEEEKTT